MNRVAQVLLDAKVGGSEGLTELLLLTDGIADGFAEPHVNFAL